MGITGKQEMFARRLAQGETQSEAYRFAYSAGSMSDATIWSEASRLAQHPQVSARVAELKAQGEGVRRMLMLDREENILARLEHEAFTAKTDSARIRALELLGRHAGMFAERVEVAQVERTAAQIEADVKARLIRLGLMGDSVGA